MQDRECVALLQWALPRLQRPWAGFRKVRKQVCQRVERRRRAPAGRAASLGCASGEEPYTLTLAWQFALAPQFPGLRLEVTATDVVAAVLERARVACYAATNLKLLPPAGRRHGFERMGGRFCLRAPFPAGGTFFDRER